MRCGAARPREIGACAPGASCDAAQRAREGFVLQQVRHGSASWFRTSDACITRQALQTRTNRTVATTTTQRLLACVWIQRVAFWVIGDPTCAETQRVWCGRGPDSPRCERKPVDLLGSSAVVALCQPLNTQREGHAS